MISLKKWKLWDKGRVVVRRWRRGRHYRGTYSSWSEARAASSGYDAEAITNRVIEATRAVRDGHAAWERDTVLYYESICHHELLETLTSVASACGGRLSVLDFGGALGSVWWQHRHWLRDIPEVRWGVVERPALVEVGRREFGIGPLMFFESLEEYLNRERPNVILLSAVLAYLEFPHELIERLTSCRAECLILDRVGFTKRGGERLTVQRVPQSIYTASYPCWFFDRGRLLAPLMEEWYIEKEWPSLDGDGFWFEYRGMVLRRHKGSCGNPVGP